MEFKQININKYILGTLKKKMRNEVKAMNSSKHPSECVFEVLTALVKKERGRVFQISHNL